MAATLNVVEIPPARMRSLSLAIGVKGPWPSSATALLSRLQSEVGVRDELIIKAAAQLGYIERLSP
jgi:hypothetical protein